MEDEQDSTIQKKLSFSIDNILDKPQPLFIKIKHHHHLLIDSNNHHHQRLTSADDNKHIHYDEHHGSSDCSAISTSDDDESCSDDGIISQYNHHEIIHRKKKTRTVFSRTQIFQLETTFDRKRYLSSADRANLAQGLRLTEQQVKIWFQNRRNKLKRQIVEASQSINSVVASLQTPSSTSSSNHTLSLPSDFSSSSSSKQHHRHFDPASFYELATLAAAHAAAAFHNNKSQTSTTFQDFANSLTTQTAV
ncbi:unnamed protein product [Adineta steineri]|uniref:Homeobox domain-containing protein n=1 Tax=Adineta steineri TaxID=433720 RepID=A0A814GDW2_9BILA|nr:unnamed protein product [Adineta steineri]CAF0994898.1 unnamed protein product [Adineta steineri]CAF1011140.1 unnamed protein product [Adineta steineri]CAF3536257.1 unnamed protein product [Adineta steineri]CAF3630431.1 unnamed protein product [Adineta steineri]